MQLRTHYYTRSLKLVNEPCNHRASQALSVFTAASVTEAIKQVRLNSVLRIQPSRYRGAASGTQALYFGLVLKDGYVRIGLDRCMPKDSR